MTYELYWISGSPNSWRVMLTLEIKGISYVSHRIDPAKSGHKTPAFLAMNPRGKVPVLKAGELFLYESIAIMAFLEREHPDPPLFGATAAETGHIWQRVFEVMNYAREAINNGVVRPLIRGQAADGAKAIKAAAIEAHAGLVWIEQLLSRAPYLAGSALSAADIVYVPIMQNLIRAAKRPDARPLDLGFLPFDARYPSITAWLRRLESLPVYDKAAPPHWREKAPQT